MNKFFRIASQQGDARQQGLMSLIDRSMFTRALFLLSLSLLTACGGSSGGGDPTPVTVLPVPAARGLLPDLARSDDTFEGDHHSGSGQCSTCHSDASMSVQTPVTGVFRDVSIGTAWESSVMANATRDPYWHAAVAFELYNYPELDEVINDKCTVCHAPTAHDMAAKEGISLRVFDTGSIETGDFQQGIYSMDDSSELFNHAMDGVTCTLCHQMEPDGFGTEDSMTGGYVITGSPTGDPADRPAYGQYPDPQVGYMRQNANFLAQHGPHLSTSETCATCHNLTITPVDADGNVMQGQHFVEQAIYTEWLNSDYAVGGPKEANCQACHMPKVDDLVYIAQGADIKRPDFSEHTFLGANTVMQDMFKNFANELGIDPGIDFDESIARNREFLRGAATVRLTQGELQAGQLNFDVNIVNHTGHKLPGGYHARRVYLHVQVLDQQGELVFESGRMNPDGSIVGVVEDLDPAKWEPHYDVISSENQVQVYQVINGNSNGERTHSLLENSQYLKDNRLTPSGYNKFAIEADTTIHETVGTFGKAYQDPDFNLGQDTVTYQVSVPESGVYTVSAELRYQPLNFGHLQYLWSYGDRIDQIDMFRTIYEGTTLRDEVIDTATLVMQ